MKCVVVLTASIGLGSIAHAEAVDPVRLLRDLASRDPLVAAPAATQLLSSPHTYGNVFLLRAIHTAARLRLKEHMGPLAAIVQVGEIPMSATVRAAAALALGEMGRISKASLLPGYGVSDVLPSSAGSTTDEEPGGCGGRPVASTATTSDQTDQPGLPDWLTDEAKLAIVGCIAVGQPALVRQACIRASGIGSVGIAVPALQGIVGAQADDPITVLLAARALSRLTRLNHVIEAIRQRAADYLAPGTARP